MCVCHRMWGTLARPRAPSLCLSVCGGVCVLDVDVVSCSVVLKGRGLRCTRLCDLTTQRKQQSPGVSKSTVTRGTHYLRESETFVSFLTHHSKADREIEPSLLRGCGGPPWTESGERLTLMRQNHWKDQHFSSMRHHTVGNFDP